MARHGEGKGHLTVQDIAEGEGLSPEYTAKLMRVLRQGGLVTSMRGAAGGYRLARPANRITLRESLEVLGGALFSESFCDDHAGLLRDCVHSTGCSVRALWGWLAGTMRQLLDHVTLEDLGRQECHMADWLNRLAEVRSEEA